MSCIDNILKCDLSKPDKWVKDIVENYPTRIYFKKDPKKWVKVTDVNIYLTTYTSSIGLGKIIEKKTSSITFTIQHIKETMYFINKTKLDQQWDDPDITVSKKEFISEIVNLIKTCMNKKDNGLYTDFFTLRIRLQTTYFKSTDNEFLFKTPYLAPFDKWINGSIQVSSDPFIKRNNLTDSNIIKLICNNPTQIRLTSLLSYAARIILYHYCKKINFSKKSDSKAVNKSEQLLNMLIHSRLPEYQV